MATSNIAALAPTLFSAANEVSAEQFGAINAINTMFDNKGVAKGDVVKVPYAGVQSLGDFTPAATPPEGTAQTAAAVSVTIDKSKVASMVLTGEQIRSLENGDSYNEWVKQWMKQGMRALRNAAEVDACAAIALGASRATGTAGTAPFSSSLDDLINVKKILIDNGAPLADLQFVGNSSTFVNLSKLNIIQQASAAGTDAERRSGVIQPQFGFQMRPSAGLATHTAGSWSSGTATVASIGAVSATVTNSTGDFLAGDIVSIADIPGKYVLPTIGDAAAETITINRPGFLASGSTKAITIEAAYTPNLAFERSAVVGIMRPPIMPANATMRQMTVSDNYGLTYLFVEIEQYGQISWELHLAWGFKVVNPEHVAILMG